MNPDSHGQSQASPYPSTVVDERGETFQLEDEPLGKGGQGVVIRARNTPEVVVKFSAIKDESPRAVRKRLRRHLEDVRLLPLEGLHIASPMEMLRGEEVVGYTMRLLRDMVPISELIATSEDTGLVEFYLKGGGLRRRLRLLEKAAALLARLHATPLVYGDISAENIFVSEPVEASEVWFIDSDNLSYTNEVSRSIYTPMFGAPEVVRADSGISTLSDVYSLAILAFWVLVQSHPFLGQAIESRGWDATSTASTDKEQQALEGRLPYIDDPEDPTNAGTDGFSTALQLVLSHSLRELFRQIFTQGRINRLARPKAAEFADAFRKAADMTVRCTECASTFFVTAGSCPWCEAENSAPDIIFIQARRWDPRLDDEDWEKLFQSNVVYWKVIETSEPSTLGRHVVAAAPSRLDNDAEIKVDCSEDGVELECVSDREFWLVTDVDSTPVRLTGKKILPMPKENRRWHLHCGPLDKPHRLLSFQFFAGGQR